MSWTDANGYLWLFGGAPPAPPGTDRDMLLLSNGLLKIAPFNLAQ